METSDLDISAFDEEVLGGALKVDFGRARKLAHSGSTCDTYECVIQRRRVFVKRLKPEFRDNALYRAAFDKEYDLGVGLSHCSLPRYVAYGDDYLVMDYIEGETLGELIRRSDERLKDKSFVDRLLGELIDVVEYLHRHQVVHCDIKPDNIIVSPYDGQPLTLVDFDKAYTSWLSDTAGNPAKYDCETCSDGQVDFKGICAVADLLGQKRLAALYNYKDLTIELLRKALLKKSILKNRMTYLLGLMGIMISGGVVLWILNRPINEPTQPIESAIVELPDKETMESVIPEPETKVLPVVVSESFNNQQAKIIEKEINNSPETSVKHIDTTEVASENEFREPTVEDIDRIVLRYYGPLYSQQDYLNEYINDTTLTGDQLRNAIGPYVEAQMKAQSEILNGMRELYGRTEEVNTLQKLVSGKEWSKFMTRDYKLCSLYFNEQNRRFKRDSKR